MFTQLHQMPDAVGWAMCAYDTSAQA